MRKPIDIAILKALEKKRDMVTYVIRNTLTMRCYGFYFPSDLETRTVLRACRRLESRGEIREARTSYAVMKCWAITDAGECALKEEG